jgi:hypothetical protein
MVYVKSSDSARNLSSDRFASPIQQIQTDNFTVENGALRSQSGQSFPQDFKTLVRVSTAGDQAALPVLDIGQRSEPVVLQLKNPIGIVKSR